MVRRSLHILVKIHFTGVALPRPWRLAGGDRHDLDQKSKLHLVGGILRRGRDV